jgi:hypothetical protein
LKSRDEELEAYDEKVLEDLEDVKISFPNLSRSQSAGEDILAREPKRPMADFKVSSHVEVH